MNLIVAVDKNWGIGCEGCLLFHIPADMKFFKEQTMAKVVVMGDLTFKSLPGAKPLINRTNIVLSQDPLFHAEGVLVCRSLAEFFKLMPQYDSDGVFVIGGATIYKELLPYCEYAYITKIDEAAPADRHLPNIDALPNWRLVETSSKQNYHDLTFTFNTYKNSAVKKFY